MCILTLALDAHPDFPLILTHNRDEYHARQTTAVQQRSDGLVCATDVSGGGTWLGVNPADGGLAALTNVRCRPRAGVRSRGELVSRVLLGDEAAAASSEYGGYHLWHCRLRADGTRTAVRKSVSSPVDGWTARTTDLGAASGILVKSNDHADAMVTSSSCGGYETDTCTWPKAAWLQAEVTRILAGGALDGAAGEAGARAVVDALAPALCATRLPPPYSAAAAAAEPSPWSSLTAEHERWLHAAPFVSPLELPLGEAQSGRYGTVSQTVVLHCRSERCVWYAYRETVAAEEEWRWTWRRVGLPEK